MKNLKYSWYSVKENQAKVDAALQADMGNKAGVDPSGVTVAGSRAVATTSRFRLMAEDYTKFVVGVPVEGGADFVSTFAKSLNSTGSIDFATVNSVVPAAGRVSPLQDMSGSNAKSESVDASEVGVDYSGNDAAGLSTSIVSMTAALLVVIVALMF
jgi:hypothetical protein